jgi:hypothetical protein
VAVIAVIAFVLALSLGAVAALRRSAPAPPPALAVREPAHR